MQTRYIKYIIQGIFDNFTNLRRNIYTLVLVIGSSYESTYVNGVTGFSDGDRSGLLGLFLADPNGFFLGLDGLYIFFDNNVT